MSTAADLDWGEIAHFSPEEWPEGVLGYMSAELIEVIDSVRDRLEGGQAMIPSPVPEAHVRHDDSDSRHSTKNKERLSDATDFFMRWRDAWDAWVEFQRHPDIGGIGIYTDMVLDGEPGELAMFHIDQRPERLMWAGWREDEDDDLSFVYFDNDPIAFFDLLATRAGD